MRRLRYTVLSATGALILTLVVIAFLIGGVITVGLFAKQQRARRVYPLKVVHGSGSGDYNAGVRVPIVADPPPEGHRFVQWSAVPDGIGIDSVSSASTTIVTIDEPLEITARYSPFPPKQELPAPAAAH